jgi:hypothetical protein
MREYKDVALETMRSQIGRFGITGAAQTLAIKHLSDGLKSRVVFAWLAYRNPHLLLLVCSSVGALRRKSPSEPGRIKRVVDRARPRQPFPMAEQGQKRPAQRPRRVERGR